MKKSIQNEKAPCRSELSKTKISAGKQQTSQISANKHLRPTALEPLMKPSKSADSLDSGIYSRYDHKKLLKKKFHANICVSLICGLCICALE